MKSKKWVVVGAEVAGLVSPGNDAVKHSAKSDSIDGSLMNTETDDPTTPLVHDH